jgi:murein tripeptide amidase MpaA
MYFYTRKKYLIVVFPMANPDGVIHGNSRTNLVGLDINRKWEGLPDKKFSYEIYHIFHYILSKVPSIEYLLDFHGHSKK